MINSFQGKYWFLANSYEAPVEYKGVTYRNNKEAFQAQKSIKDGNMRNRTMEMEEMRAIVYAKFSQNPELAAQLLATGEAHLEAGNTWGDDFWGTVNGIGANYLGKILMQVRETLRQEKEDAYIDRIRSEHYYEVFDIMYSTGFAPLVMAALHKSQCHNDFTGVLDIYARPAYLQEIDAPVSIGRPIRRSCPMHYSFAILQGEILEYYAECEQAGWRGRSYSGKDILPLSDEEKKKRCSKNHLLGGSKKSYLYERNPFLEFSNSTAEKTFPYCKELASHYDEAPTISIVFNERFTDVKISYDRKIDTFGYGYKLEIPQGDYYDFSDIKFTMTEIIQGHSYRV